MPITWWRVWTLVAVALAAACEAPGDGAQDAIAPRQSQENGVALNAAVINGWHLNGWHLNGEALNGWHLNGWHLNGAQLQGLALEGTLFRGTQVVDGVALQRHGLDFIGSEIHLVGGSEDHLLRIDDIALDDDVPGGDVYVYKVSVYDPAAAAWRSLCTDAGGEPTEAIPLQNTWDEQTGARVDSPTAITLACRGAVLAKCVEWGYRPWAKAKDCSGSSCKYVSLRDHHQACTRMARADYCGDGVPYTLSGTPIDLYDRLSPRIQQEATAKQKHWRPEAEWGPSGAVCIGDALRMQLLDEIGATYPLPACLSAIDHFSNCGALPASRGGKLANSYCERWNDGSNACHVNGKMVDDDEDEDEDEEGDDDDED